ncbi:hypothetical protein ACFY1L_09830 [Streptomyces sp. NPDC001663]|uniref:hypothetical protein n=1 Tax=Streptomyces sp. NPDC001663 TaxID=3364597 RepID=UPI0036A5CBAF
MLANLFTVTELEPPTFRSALADLLAVQDEAVDVADTDGDQETRRWDAPVLCTYRVLPLGDLALELDLYVEDRTAGALTEAGLAQGLALRTTTSVLHPALDLDLPSAYRVATRDGRSVRCRLEAIDSDEDTTYRVDVMEEKVADLPRAKVEILPEILEHERIATPVSDAFLATFPTGQLVTEVDDDHAEGLRTVLSHLDADFRKWTYPGTQPDPERWWWHRTPSPRSIPW